MSDRSAIEWTDATWNPIRARHKGRPVPAGKLTREIGWHCEHVSEACRNCYAERINRRLGTGLDFKPGHRKDIEIFLDDKTLTAPLRWRKPRMIFPCSMTDLFGDWVSDEWLDRIFAVMALTPQHAYQVLTKRPARMRAYLTAATDEPWYRYDAISEQMLLMGRVHPGFPRVTWPLKNIWLVVSIGDQPDADKFVPILLDTPAAVRGVSYEPALGPVDLRCLKLPNGDAINALSAQIGKARDDGAHERVWFPREPRTCIDWVICGGESGPNARPMHPAWAQSMRDQCAAAGVPFFFKQWGAWGPLDHSEAADESAWEGRGDWMVLAADGDLDIPDGRWPDETAGEVAVVRVGKKAAGRLLDGVEHNGFPARA